MDSVQPRGRDPSVLRVHGAREHNLKGVTIELRKRQLIVFTGVSGSGESSLVFETPAAQSQRQINFSSSARYRLPHQGKPGVDRLENLTAANVVDARISSAQSAGEAPVRRTS